MTPKQMQAQIEADRIHEEAARKMAEVRRKRNEELKKQRNVWGVGPKKTVRRPAGGVS